MLLRSEPPSPSAPHPHDRTSRPTKVYYPIRSPLASRNIADSLAAARSPHGESAARTPAFARKQNGADGGAARPVSGPVRRGSNRLFPPRQRTRPRRKRVRSEERRGGTQVFSTVDY